MYPPILRGRSLFQIIVSPEQQFAEITFALAFVRSLPRRAAPRPLRNLRPYEGYVAASSALTRTGELPAPTSAGPPGSPEASDAPGLRAAQPARGRYTRSSRSLLGHLRRRAADQANTG